MPPAIHPVDLVQVLRHKNLTPAIIFLTSRRSCDEAIDSFAYRPVPLPKERTEAITQVFDDLISQYPSIADHPLIPLVQQYGVAAHHAGHLPSWKIAIEELMRSGCLDAVFATTTLAAGVDFPARTVVISQSSVRKARDFTDLTVGEIQQLAGRGGRRGKDLVGFVVLTPSPYMDLHVLTRGLTGYPEPIDSQFVISYPMVLNLLKAHTVDHIQPILEKSFAQYQINQRAESLEEKLDQIQSQFLPYGPRECSDWISQWQLFDLAQRKRQSRSSPTKKDSPELTAQLPFLTPGRVVGLNKGRGVILRFYRSRGHHLPMVTLMKHPGKFVETSVASLTQIFDHMIDFTEMSRYPWGTPRSLEGLVHDLTNLPSRLRILPIRIEPPNEDNPIVTETLRDEFPCPACPSRPACRKDHLHALRLRQENHRLTKTIHALRSELWHRFQENVEVLQKFGYLTLSSQLTSDGEWARLIRINHSLLITELIRMEAFTGIAPSLLTGILASIALDDDRPGAFPRRRTELATVMGQVRAVADSLAPYEEPPLLRMDIAALADRWVSQPTLPWKDYVRMTSMAEGDVYRLLARTLEYLSQITTMKSTHPGLADIADQAIVLIRRDVLEELP
jgi:superfamily II RNA helicase